MATESLIVELDAKTSKLDSKLKKSEKGLDGFDKSAKGADKSLGKMSVSAGVVGEAIKLVTAAVAAGTTAMVAYGVAVGRSAQETENMAKLAGVSAEEFKALDFAMKRVGISAEKFGGQSKDAAERVGEFITEVEKSGKGAGPLQDFFDVLKLTDEQAKEMAKTMDSFTGEQILQHMVTEMERVDASAKQMSFALESVASDTTLLIPLLKEGGKELSLLKDDFNSLNNELSDREKQNYIDFANNMDALTTSFQSFMANALAPFIPAMGEATRAVAEFFAEWNTELDLDRIGDAIREGDLTEIFADADTLKEIEQFNAQLETLASQQMKMLENRQAALDAQAEAGPVVVAGRGGETQEAFEERIGRMQEDIDNTNAYYEQIKQAQLDFAAFQEEQKTETGDPADADGTILPTGKFMDVQLEVEQEYYDESLARHKEFLDQKQSDLDKAEKARQKQIDADIKAEQDAEKQKRAIQDTVLNSAMALNTALFDDNKAVRAGLVVADTAMAITRQFADLPYPAALATSAAIAANGVVQLAAINSSSKGGGGVSAPSGTTVPETADPDFEPETTSLEVSEQSELSTQTTVVQFSADSGDELVDAIASALNKSMVNGR